MEIQVSAWVFCLRTHPFPADTPPPTEQKARPELGTKNIDILPKTTPEFRAERLRLVKILLDITPLR